MQLKYKEAREKTVAATVGAGCLVEETETHILVGLLLLLFLLLLSRGVSGSTASSSGSATSSSGSTATGADVDQEVLDLLALKSLGED